MPKYPKHKKLSVARSKAGLGLFAIVPFKRGELVCEYTGKLLSSEEADKRGGKYLFDLSRKLVIDGSGRKNLARYINHSCKPNCFAERDEEVKKIFLYAKKKISPGEEISYHYGKDYFEGYIKPLGCQCNFCRK